MSDFFSLGGGAATGGGGITDRTTTTTTTGGGIATTSNQQLVLPDQLNYPVNNPSDAFYSHWNDSSSSAASTRAVVPWFYNPCHHQEEQQFFRHHHHQQQQDLYAAAAAAVAAAADSSSLRVGVVGVGLGIGGGGIRGRSCQDCGNQAKKDCVHVRCRSCCKSRGVDCPTHVKSTWVPAAKRRARQQQLEMTKRQQPTTEDENEEKARFDDCRQRETEDTSVAAAACTRLTSNNTSSGFTLGSFPPELSSPAVFRCVRISSLNDPDDQYAYQTAVSIGGHVFKGILYDNGPGGSYYDSDATALVGAGGGRDTTSSGGVVQPLDLIAASSSGAAGMSRNAAKFFPSMYQAATTAALDAYTAGTQFFPHHQKLIISLRTATQLPDDEYDRV